MIGVSMYDTRFRPISAPISSGFRHKMSQNCQSLTNYPLCCQLETKGLDYDFATFCVHLGRKHNQILYMCRRAVASYGLSENTLTAKIINYINSTKYHGIQRHRDFFLPLNVKKCQKLAIFHKRAWSNFSHS